MLSGSSFQRRGAWAQKALSPNLFRLVCCICSRFLVFDLRVFVLASLINSSLKYRGAHPCMHLEVKSRILNSILFLMGSQWRSFRIVVMWMWSYFLEPLTTLVALFWTFWSLQSCSSVESTEKSITIVKVWCHQWDNDTLVVSVLRFFLIFPMFLRWLFADLIAFDTCADIFLFGSKTAPGLPIGSLRTGTITPFMVISVLGVSFFARICPYISWLKVAGIQS